MQRNFKNSLIVFFTPALIFFAAQMVYVVLCLFMHENFARCASILCGFAGMMLGVFRLFEGSFPWEAK
jgi:positive regulator of sigma E activity